MTKRKANKISAKQHPTLSMAAMEAIEAYREFEMYRTGTKPPIQGAINALIILGGRVSDFQKQEVMK